MNSVAVDDVVVVFAAVVFAAVVFAAVVFAAVVFVVEVWNSEVRSKKKDVLVCELDLKLNLEQAFSDLRHLEKMEGR